jgi:signal peptidase I
MSLPAETPPIAPVDTSPGDTAPPYASSQNPLRILYPTLLDAARSFASLLVVALFILTFILQPFRIPSESMERTLLVGDFLLVD